MLGYFAKISETNIVENVVIIPDEQIERGDEYLSIDLQLGGKWIQTDPLSRGGIKYENDGVTTTNLPTLRYTYASIGYLYHPDLDIFTPPKPYPSWILNSNTAEWQPPTPMPETGGPWEWNEESLSWITPS